MPTTDEELDNQRSWAEHHARNPKWGGERKAQEQEQARKNALAQIKATRANRAAASAAAAAAAPNYTAAPSVDVNNTNAGEASSSDNETASTSSSRSSTSRRSSPSSAPSSQSPSPVINGALPAPAASAAPAQAAATSSEASFANSFLPTKPSPSVKSLESMFDDDEDFDTVYGSKNTKASVETSTKASSTPSRKRKLPFGDDDSEGESDFEGSHQGKKSRTSSVDSSADSKCKYEEDAIKPQAPAKTKFAITTIVKHASALVNGRAGCYQNAVLHLLSSIPAFAAMGTEEPLECAKAGIAPAFSKIMRKMLNNTSNNPISTKSFQRASGKVFGSLYKRQTQEDADEYLCALVERLQEERPGLKLAAQLEAPAFVRKANCTKCGTVKEVSDTHLSLMPPMNFAKPVSFNDMLKEQADDTSAFEHRSCDKCKSTGSFKTNTKAARNTMRNTPSFLKVMVSRLDPNGSTAKNRTRVVLPRECSLLSESGETLRYKLVAAAGHNGRSPERGHWMALRKVGNKWFQCDSAGAGFRGAKQLERADFDHENTHASMCLFKKVE